MKNIKYYYKRLRDLREDNDLTQSDIAKVLNIRQEYYSKYELGKIEIPTHYIKQLAMYYKVSSDYLIGLTNNPEPNYVIKNKLTIKGNKNTIEKIEMK